MARPKTVDERFVEWIENHRVVIGFSLILLILAGAITLSVINRPPKVVEQPVVDPAFEEQLKLVREQNEMLRSQLEEVRQAQTAARVAGETAQVRSAKSDIEKKTDPPASQSSGLVNINIANQSQLESLPGIGSAYAGRIIEYRNANGGFKTKEEIKKIKGIGEKTFEKLKDKIEI